MFGKRVPASPNVAVRLDPLTQMRAELTAWGRAERCVFIGTRTSGALEIICVTQPANMRRAVQEARAAASRNGIAATVLERGDMPAELLTHLGQNGWVAGDRRGRRR